jgi:hypothetical protein
MISRFCDFSDLHGRSGETVRMSLQTVTDKIDGILWAVVLVISGGLWAVAGFPHFTEIVVVLGLFIACIIVWWMTSRSQE